MRNFHEVIPMSSDAATKLQAEMDRTLAKLHTTIWATLHNDFISYQASANALRDAGVKTHHAPPSSFGQWLKDVADQTVAKTKGASS